MAIPPPPRRPRRSPQEQTYVLLKAVHVLSVVAFVVMIFGGGWPGRWLFGMFLAMVVSAAWAMHAYGEMRDEKLPPHPDSPEWTRHGAGHSGRKEFTDFQDDTGEDASDD